MKKVVGYIRVSTQEQAKEGISLRHQEEKIKLYCESQDWKLVRVFRDEGSTGKNLDREGVKELMTYLFGEHSGWAVIVYKVDRLTRRQKDLWWLLENFFEPRRIGFKSVTEPFDTTTAMGKGFLGMLGVFAQLEGDLISERTREALQFKKQNGEPLGPPALGFQAEDKKRIEDPQELETVAYIKSLRRKRLSHRKIAAKLNEEKIPTKRGKKWHRSTVSYVLKNPSYKGHILDLKLKSKILPGVATTLS